MSTYKYSQLAYFDGTASASCVGSALYIASVGPGCNAAIGANSNSRTCLPNIEINSTEYKYYLTSCSDEPIDYLSSMRSYVVKSDYTLSDSCEGTPIQVTAVAADATCHIQPGQSDKPTWFKVNCNGDQPIWSTCKDSLCSNCEEKRYTRDVCQLTGAGASTSVKCVMPSMRNNGTTTTSTGTSSIVPPTATEDTLTFGSGSRRNTSLSMSDWVLVVVLGMWGLFQMI